MKNSLNALSLIFLILLQVSCASLSNNTAFRSVASNEDPFKELVNSTGPALEAHRKAQIQSTPSSSPVVTIAVLEEDLDAFFPADPKDRVDFEARALIADDSGSYRAVVSPGGQSTLTAATPNLRVKKLKHLNGQDEGLRGVRNIDGSTRINPLTMDEGYIATKLYQEMINMFGLVPSRDQGSHFQLESNFTRVEYVPIDTTGTFGAPGKLMPEKSRSAGLHLVNFHPVKFLADAQSTRYGVRAVVRSRYNIENLRQSVLNQPLESDFFTSRESLEDTTPFRAEHKWASDESAQEEIERLIREVYAAPKKYEGERLYEELSKRMDVEQLFKFLALNHMLQNGDISDEYFWYTQIDKSTGKVRLQLLPQDGDDMLKGVHMFPFHPKQIKLIATDKAGLRRGFIGNFEDPLFRIVKDDPTLYARYLEEYHSMATTFIRENPSPLQDLIRSVANPLQKFMQDEDVLSRGKTDEIGRAYRPGDFLQRANDVYSRVKENARTAKRKIEGDLEVSSAFEKAQRKAALQNKRVDAWLKEKSGRRNFLRKCADSLKNLLRI